MFALLLALLVALPATETFTGVAGNLGANWTHQRTTRRVNQNGSGAGTQDAIDAVADVTAFWSADGFSLDQYSQVAVVAIGTAASGHSINTTVRASGTGDAGWNAYEFYTDLLSGAGHTELSRVNAGTATVLRNFATTFAANDLLRIEIRGYVIECFKALAASPTLFVSLGTYDDSASASKLTTGSPGVGSFANGAGTLPTFDNWEGGNLPGRVGPMLGSLAVGPQLGIY